MQRFIKTTTLIASAVLLTALAAPASAGGLAKQWYMKMTLLVENGDNLVYDDRSGVFGRLKGARWDADRRDIPAFSNASRSPGAIVFDVPNHETATQFLSNYKPRGKNRQVWDFTVYSANPNGTPTGGTATLVWEGLYEIAIQQGEFVTTEDTTDKVLNRLRLVDRETGQVIRARKNGELQSYTFDFGDKASRNFRWVQGRPTAEDRQLAPAPQAMVPASSLTAKGSGAAKTRSSYSAELPMPPSFSSPAPTDEIRLPTEAIDER